jgi:hypothetical protein
LDEHGFEDTASTFPQPYAEFANIDPLVCPPFSLPSVLVPPEIIELDSLSADAGEDTQVKKEEWPEYFLRFFNNEVRVWANICAAPMLMSRVQDYTRSCLSFGICCAIRAARHRRYL